MVEVGGGCLSSLEENKRLHVAVLRMPCGMRTYELICAFYRTDSNNHSFCADSKNKFIRFCYNIRCHQVSFDVTMILMHMFLHNHKENLELFWKQCVLGHIVRHLFEDGHSSNDIFFFYELKQGCQVWGGWRPVPLHSQNFEFPPWRHLSPP